eukprot:1189225-Prorocentrum_minimum.AAC.3
MRRYILTADQSDAGRAGIFSRRTHQTRDAQVYSHGGPVRRTTRSMRPSTASRSAEDAAGASGRGPPEVAATAGSGWHSAP